MSETANLRVLSLGRLSPRRLDARSGYWHTRLLRDIAQEVQKPQMHDLRNLACLILLSDPRNNARRFLLRPLIWLVNGLSFRVISVTFRLIEAGQNPFEVSFMGICPPAMTDYGLAHDLLNELMIVIAECDLLAEEFLKCGVSKHLHVIRETAVHMSQRIAARSRPVVCGRSIDLRCCSLLFPWRIVKHIVRRYLT